MVNITLSLGYMSQMDIVLCIVLYSFPGSISFLLYFCFPTARLDRYNHELEEDSEEGGEGGAFPSFSSYSPRYHKITSSQSTDTPQLDSSFQVKAV